MTPFESLGIGFLFALHSYNGRIFGRLWDIHRKNSVTLKKLGYGLFKVIENGVIR